MTTSQFSCTVYFKKNGTFARLQVPDPFGDKLFTVTASASDDTSIHGVVLFGKNQPSQFTGSQKYIVRSAAWKTVLMVGDSLEETIVVVIDNYNAENNHLDSGTGVWG